MRILAIESSGRHGSVAALHGDGDHLTVARQTILDVGQRTAQSLAPAIKQLLSDLAWPAKSLGLIAVTTGPGSFTGLRIGATTAKTMAYALGADIIGVNTLVALAAQAPPATKHLWTVLDAHRQELFAAKFVADSQVTYTMDCATQIISQDAWLAGLKIGDYVTGPPLRKLAQRLPAGVAALPDAFWQPTAAAVGQVAWQMYRRGHRDDVWQIVPNYYRPSYAEEKAATNEGRATNE
jgi:tRNA threonylcarbamoyladenosine biosynthesis protein TsaB